jgi:predicted alpha/beta-hydrolase family hydrolase
MMSEPEAIVISLPGGGEVSGLLQAPPDAFACYVLAHGAGAGMTHPFMEAVATGLASRKVATLRFQFPYMERGSKRPDSGPVAQATVRAAVAAAASLVPGMPLIAGGRSFGGRMTSQAQAEAPLEGVRGLAFLGFPLHPAKRPATARADHLSDVRVPMLFVQGTRDELADPALTEGVCARLGPRAVLHAVDDADHSFHVRARSGRTDAAVREEILDAVAAWARSVLGG